MIKTGSDSDILTGSFMPIVRSGSSSTVSERSGGGGGGGHARYTFLENGSATSANGVRLRNGVSRRQKFLFGVIFALAVLVALLTAVVLSDRLARKSSSSPSSLEVGNCSGIFF